jgi:hypothetical protein
MDLGHPDLEHPAGVEGIEPFLGVSTEQQRIEIASQGLDPDRPKLLRGRDLRDDLQELRVD